ncbi:aldo/keto reductase [Nocardioides sp. ChNu-153]|uniref:aldo/keto reductase n=1 Tax=unclassified Nocardioides TaxID=2615069 RepID=UPI0024058E90|nr:MULTISPECIES: aldo/keto reductase [unclassified Nocardioides]MDF9717033.1 aldo/keto reductase [Nocardioides sp. ChNu-99]MDN7122255.1 aldo/keto reductase [Nocardioides sp. ChNu-153]
MTTTDVPTHTLNDGTTLPAVGFGTYPLRGDEAVRGVRSALEVGYRLIDTAVNYENEEAVGEALRTSGLDREAYQVTSKIPGRHHAYDDAVASVEGSLRRLGLDHLDLQLIHWPNPGRDQYVEAWRALVDLRERGLVRSIGVSNFTEQHVERIVDATGVAPSVNQVELHPYFPQEALRRAHERWGVLTEAWSPLARVGDLADEPAVIGPAERLGVDPAAVVLRWHVQIGSLPIPKSASPERQRSNLDVLAFTLSDEEVAALTALGRPDGRIFDADPETHEEL